MSFLNYLIILLYPSEKAMAPHSITLAWQIPWTEDPGRLQSMGLLRVGHDWVTFPHSLMSIESVMPSNHLILSSPSPPTFNLSQHQGLFHESFLRIRWPKYWSFSISPSSEYSGLISFRIDWFDLLAVQGTLKSLLQYHSSKASILRCYCTPH